jgi:hypothetical protein
MHLEGTVIIAAPQDEVWNFLTNPDRVGSCVPGLQSMKIIEPDKKFGAIAGIGLGAVKVTFNAEIEWLELDRPNRAKMKARGVAPGSSMDAVSEMKLSQTADRRTELQWTAEVTIVGKIASLASRLMGSVSQKMAGEFFNCVRNEIEK